MPVVVASSEVEISAIGTPTRTMARVLETPNLSRTPAMTTSMMEIIDVTPANTNEPKNSTPISDPPGASEMIVGNATNANVRPEETTSPTPTPCACAMNPRAAKTPMPASISKLEFANPTTRPEPVRSVLRFRYEE